MRISKKKNAGAPRAKHGIRIDEILPHVSSMNAGDIEALQFGLECARAELAMPGYTSPEALWFLDGGGLEKYLRPELVKTILSLRHKGTKGGK
jgi:hypothetical protein